MGGENDLPQQQPEHLGELRHVDPNSDPDKLLRHWLEGSGNAGPIPEPEKGTPCSEIGLWYSVDGPKQPEPPGSGATDQQWAAYDRAHKTWQQESNEHVETSDKVIKFDRLNDDQREAFKDDIKRFLLNPTVAAAQLPQQQRDTEVKALEQEVKSTEDAQKWTKAISEWDHYRDTHCLPRL